MTTEPKLVLCCNFLATISSYRIRRLQARTQEHLGHNLSDHYSAHISNLKLARRGHLLNGERRWVLFIQILFLSILLWLLLLDESPVFTRRSKFVPQEADDECRSAQESKERPQSRVISRRVFRAEQIRRNGSGNVRNGYDTSCGDTSSGCAGYGGRTVRNEGNDSRVGACDHEDADVSTGHAVDGGEEDVACRDEDETGDDVLGGQCCSLLL